MQDSKNSYEMIYDAILQQDEAFFKQSAVCFNEWKPGCYYWSAASQIGFEGKKEHESFIKIYGGLGAIHYLAKGAARSGDSNWVNTLIAEGASWNMAAQGYVKGGIIAEAKKLQTKGLTPASLAYSYVRNGYIAEAEQLIQANRIPLRYIAFAAAVGKQFSYIKTLLARGVTINDCAAGLAFSGILSKKYLPNIEQKDLLTQNFTSLEATLGLEEKSIEEGNICKVLQGLALAGHVNQAKQLIAKMSQNAEDDLINEMISAVINGYALSGRRVALSQYLENTDICKATCKMLAMGMHFNYLDNVLTKQIEESILQEKIEGAAQNNIVAYVNKIIDNREEKEEPSATELRFYAIKGYSYSGNALEIGRCFDTLNVNEERQIKVIRHIIKDTASVGHLGLSLKWLKVYRSIEALTQGLVLGYSFIDPKGQLFCLSFFNKAEIKAIAHEINHSANAPTTISPEVMDHAIQLSEKIKLGHTYEQAYLALLENNQSVLWLARCTALTLHHSFFENHIPEPIKYIIFDYALDGYVRYFASAGDANRYKSQQIPFYRSFVVSKFLEQANAYIENVSKIRGFKGTSLMTESLQSWSSDIKQSIQNNTRDDEHTVARLQFIIKKTNNIKHDKGGFSFEDTAWNRTYKLALGSLISGCLGIAYFGIGWLSGLKKEQFVPATVALNTLGVIGISLATLHHYTSGKLPNPPQTEELRPSFSS